MNRTLSILLSTLIIFILTACSESDGYSTSHTATQLALPSKSPVIETNPSNWYIRIVAQDITRGLKREDAQLGQLEVSDATSQHTLRSYYDFDGYFDVLFIDPTGVPTGQYRSNFHPYQDSTEDRWSFTVMSSDATINVAISLRGLYILTPYQEDDRMMYKEYRSTTNPLLKQMKLVDTATGTEIAAVQDGKVQTYAFNMNGKTTRTFEWVVETQEVDITKVAQRSAQRSVERGVDNTITQEIFKEEKRETFNINKPPFLKGGM